MSGSNLNSYLPASEGGRRTSVPSVAAATGASTARAKEAAKEAMSNFSSRFVSSFAELKTAVRERLDDYKEPPPSARSAPAPAPPSRQPSMPQLTPEQRATFFEGLLKQRPMPFEKIKKTCFAEGVPDCSATPRLRAIAWKLLLGYLPEDRMQWHTFLAMQRLSYQAFFEELNVVPDKEEKAAMEAAGGGDGGGGTGGGGTGGAADAADPLSPAAAVDPLGGVGGSEGDEKPVGSDCDVQVTSVLGVKAPSSAAPAAGGGGASDAVADPLGAGDSLREVADELDDSDHPLTSTHGSRWLEFHADQDLRFEIKKDVDRTLPDYAFYNTSHREGRVHHAAISRILFVYAKLNPGIRCVEPPPLRRPSYSPRRLPSPPPSRSLLPPRPGLSYVQGMNEILAPIYYVFCQEIEAAAADASGASLKSLGEDSIMPTALEEALKAVEADAFFCFTNLMAELRDHFCSKLDHTVIGITAKITALERLIERLDHQLSTTLTRLRVSPTFYGFRWITLLMTQEWELPDVLRFFDSLFADPRRDETKSNFLIYFAATMVRPRARSS